MPRIRTIKPEFWTSGQVADCSPVARLLFIGMFNFCDDHGVHPACTKRLKMQVFPADQLSYDAIQAMIDELLAAGLLYAYQVGGEDYWLVTGWAKHQKIDKPTYRHPIPGSRVQVDHSTATRRVVAEQSSNTRRMVGEQSSTIRVRNGV